MNNYNVNKYETDFEEWTRFNDIKIREILKVEEYQKEPVKILENMRQNRIINPLSRFTYFYQGNETICTGFIISTIDGKICIPVIGMKHIRVKTQIKNQLIKYLPHFEKRKITKIGLYLLYYTDLPLEIIQNICKFYISF